MKRWKWLWILPALTILAVGLGCQSEKPTAVSSAEDRAQVVVDFLPSYMEYTSHGSPSEMFDVAAQGTIAAAAARGVKAASIEVGRDLVMWDLNDPNTLLKMENMGLAHLTDDVEVATNLLNPGFEFFQPVLVETVYRCGTPDDWDEPVELEAVLVATPSLCNTKVFDEDRQPQLEDASEATRAKLGSLGRLPTSP